ncbi:MAG: polysaccharide deacetylase family protein [Chitinophagaceae bacterium]|nr:polysaccharide deacetylase family protein [Chitinophagaceae bacterium]
MKIVPPVLMILADRVTNRLSYIVETIFFKQAVVVTDQTVFNAYDGFRIAYTDTQNIATNLWIKPHGLLRQKGIEQPTIECIIWEGLPAFFQTQEGFTFDFFAASFYLITRYEEYDRSSPTDEYGRFKHENAIAYKYHFLQLPLINCWLKKLLEKNLLPLSFQLPSFSFVPTYDIDIAYSYLYRGVISNTLGFFKDFSKGDIAAVEERIAVLHSQKSDPYDVYDWLDILQASLDLKPIYFFLFADRQKGIDKNIDPQKPALQKLIKKHSTKYSIGIHPSMQSNSNHSLLETEIANLRLNAQVDITKSRQHYIFLQFPETYQNLIAAGITDDYSMGYPNVHGFRASCSFPHKWYDLEKDLPTTLVVHPFCYMDSSSIFQLSIPVTEAATMMQQYMDTIQKYGGECIMIHHNNFLTNQPDFIDWKLTYADFLISNFTC